MICQTYLQSFVLRQSWHAVHTCFRGDPACADCSYVHVVWSNATGFAFERARRIRSIYACTTHRSIDLKMLQICRFLNRIMGLPKCRISSLRVIASKAMADCRRSKVTKLAQLVCDHLCRDHLGEIRQTGSLLPTKSLRHRVTRERLAFARSLDGRWFTTCMVRDAVKEVIQGHEEIELFLPGFSREQWIDSTATSLTAILQRAKKSSMSTSAMDQLETQPYEFLDIDPAEDLLQCSIMIKSILHSSGCA